MERVCASAATPKCDTCPTGSTDARPAARRSSPPRVTLMNRKLQSYSRAYRYGWKDVRYEESCRFTENRRLAELEAPAERLDYYRGHRAGREARQHSGDLLRAS